MLRLSRFLLLAGLLPGAWAQQSYPFFSPSPSPPLLVTATANSPFGQSSYCYWVVVVYPIGKSTPSAPSCISNAIETSSVLISWSAASGASSYDVLRTTTPILPNVTSSIAVATAVSGTTQTDSFGALSSYTITSAVPATANLYLDNTAFSTPQLRAVITGVGGTTAFNLGAGGGGGSPGGSSGQVQYNNSGSFGGFTVSGDATLNTGTGALTVANGAITNAKLANSATTANGQTCTLGSTCNVNAGAAAHSVSLNEGAGAAIAAATIGTAGRLLIDQGAAADPSFNAMSGDATLAGNGAITLNTVTVPKGGTGLTSVTSNALLKGNGTGNLAITTCTVDSSNNLTCTGDLQSGSGSGVGGLIGVSQGTAPTIPSNFFGWQAPTTITTSLVLEPPNANPAANQIMLFPAPSSNVSQFAWTNGSITINTTSPLTGGATPLLGGSMTVACGTCATTTSGGALSGTAPITLSAGGAVGINFTANLQNTAGSLDTIQGIQTTSTPQFARLGLNQSADATASLAATQSIGATSTDGYILQNATAAANNAQQWSPRIRLHGSGWDTSSGGNSKTADWIIENETVQGNNPIASNLLFKTNLNGAGYNTVVSIGGINGNGGGNFVITTPGAGTTVTVAPSNITGSGNFTVASSGGDLLLNGNHGTDWGLRSGTANLQALTASIITWCPSTTFDCTVDTGIDRGSAGLVGITNGTQGTTAANFRDLQYRHTFANGTAPTLTSGTGTISGGDQGFRVTLTAGSQTTVTVTFGTAYTTNIPVLECSDETTAANNPVQTQPTLSTVVINATGTFGAADKISCVGGGIVGP